MIHSSMAMRRAAGVGPSFPAALHGTGQDHLQTHLCILKIQVELSHEGLSTCGWQGRASAAVNLFSAQVYGSHSKRSPFGYLARAVPPTRDLRHSCEHALTCERCKALPRKSQHFPQCTLHN